jgi:hypothetical protein
MALIVARRRAMSAKAARARLAGVGTAAEARHDVIDRSGRAMTLALLRDDDRNSVESVFHQARRCIDVICSLQISCRRPEREQHRRS